MVGADGAEADAPEDGQDLGVAEALAHQPAGEFADDEVVGLCGEVLAGDHLEHGVAGGWVDASLGADMATRRKLFLV